MRRSGGCAYAREAVALIAPTVPERHQPATFARLCWRRLDEWIRTMGQASADRLANLRGWTLRLGLLLLGLLGINYLLVLREAPPTSVPAPNDTAELARAEQEADQAEFERRLEREDRFADTLSRAEVLIAAGEDLTAAELLDDVISLTGPMNGPNDEQNGRALFLYAQLVVRDGVGQALGLGNPRNRRLEALHRAESEFGDPDAMLALATEIERDLDRVNMVIRLRWRPEQAERMRERASWVTERRARIAAILAEADDTSDAIEGKAP